MQSDSRNAGDTFLAARDRRWNRFLGFLERHDLFYAVPIVIAVVAFILALVFYFWSTP